MQVKYRKLYLSVPQRDIMQCICHAYAHALHLIKKKSCGVEKIEIFSRAKTGKQEPTSSMRGVGCVAKSAAANSSNATGDRRSCHENARRMRYAATASPDNTTQELTTSPSPATTKLYLLTSSHDALTGAQPTSTGTHRTPVTHEQQTNPS